MSSHNILQQIKTDAYTTEMVDQLSTIAAFPDTDIADLWAINLAIIELQEKQSMNSIWMGWAALWLGAVRNPTWNLWLLEDKGPDYLFQWTLCQSYMELWEVDLRKVLRFLVDLPIPNEWLPEKAHHDVWSAIRHFLDNTGWMAGTEYAHLHGAQSFGDDLLDAALALRNYGYDGSCGGAYYWTDKHAAVFGAIVSYCIGPTFGTVASFDHIQKAQHILSFLQSMPRKEGVSCKTF